MWFKNTANQVFTEMYVKLILTCKKNCKFGRFSHFRGLHIRVVLSDF